MTLLRSPGWHPPPHAGFGPPTRLPMARELGETSPMLPVHPMLEPEDVHFIADMVLEVLVEAAR